jgi:SAM-dependent methyltransferase
MPYVDDFSRQANEYQRYRPHYPDALFAYLAGLAPGRTLALDCGTGNGQAAVGVARHFAAVVATDASARQITHAAPHPRVTYKVAPAHQSGLAARSVDLITVAQAMHWFDLPEFYAEVRRVLRPGGVLAAWCYAVIDVDPALNRVFERLFAEIIGPYWSPGAELVSAHYRTIPFPFAGVAAPDFTLDVDWVLEDLIGYFKSWSGRQRFMDVHGYDPLDDIRDELAAAWGDPQTRRRIRWPLYFRIGRGPG